MTNPAAESVDPPFMSFRFEVSLDVAGPPPGLSNPVCNAAFSECSGLEMTMEPKAIREGGQNVEHEHRVGPVSYGQLTLRRGMTSSLQLWQWFVAAAQPGHDYSAGGTITLWDTDGTPRITFELQQCLPVKITGPSLNAREGQVAIEEMQLVYKSLTVRPAGSGASGVGLNVGFGISAGFSAGASASFSAGASLSAGGSAGLSVSGGAGLSASASASAGFGIG
jgi:phage tail-like protein